MINIKGHGVGTLGQTWEILYRVTEVLRPSTYHLEELSGKVFTHLWNAEHLKINYLIRIHVMRARKDLCTYFILRLMKFAIFQSMVTSLI